MKGRSAPMDPHVKVIGDELVEALQKCGATKMQGLAAMLEVMAAVISNDADDADRMIVMCIERLINLVDEAKDDDDD